MPRTRMPKLERASSTPGQGVVSFLNLQDVFDSVGLCIARGDRETLLPDLAAWASCWRTKLGDHVYTEALARLGLDDAEKRAFYARQLDQGLSVHMVAGSKPLFLKMAPLYWADKQALVTANWLDSEREDTAFEWLSMHHNATYSVSGQSNPFVQVCEAALGPRRKRLISNHHTVLMHLPQAVREYQHLPDPRFNEANPLVVAISNVLKFCGPNCFVPMPDNVRAHVNFFVPAMNEEMRRSHGTRHHRLDWFMLHVTSAADHLVDHQMTPNPFVKMILDDPRYSPLSDADKHGSNGLLAAVFKRWNTSFPLARCATLKALLSKPLTPVLADRNGKTLVHELLLSVENRIMNSTGIDLYEMGVCTWNAQLRALRVLLEVIPTGPRTPWARKFRGEQPSALFERQFRKWEEKMHRLFPHSIKDHDRLYQSVREILVGAAV